MDSGDKHQVTMNASMNIMRRMPPKDIPKNIAAVTTLIDDEDIKDDVLIKTDQPICKNIIKYLLFNIIYFYRNWTG